MESDEALARRLQEQFDKEVRMAEKREREDAALAQSLAAASHNLSDSEQEEEERREVQHKRQLTFESSRKEEEEERKRKMTPTALRRPHTQEESRGRKGGGGGGGRGRQQNEDNSDNYDKEEISGLGTEHTLSEEEEEGKEEERKEEESISGEQSSKNSQGSPVASLPDTHSRGPSHSSSPQTQTDTHRVKLMCKFGASCYRRNPYHLEEFSHPHLEERGGGGEGIKREAEKGGGEERKGEKRGGERRDDTPNKVMKNTHKTRSLQQAFPVRLSTSSPFHVFLNKCYSVDTTQNDPLTLVLPDLLHPSLGVIVESAQLNFMVDLDFLMTNYKAAKIDTKPLLVAYGQMEGETADYPALTCVKVQLPYQYGTHHTKAMFLLYQSGLRVIIHTANLVPDDWYEKTQGFWVSPVFPELENGKSGILEGDSATRFKRDLVDYLQAYRIPGLTRWVGIVKKHDFSECNAILVGSVPGYHTGEQRRAWGHTKVRHVLAQHSAPLGRGQRVSTIIQCSSIGSLGKDERSWLSGELGLSLGGAKTTLPVSQSKVCVVYPSEEDVRASSQGWMGGSCLPYNSSTHEKQLWLTQHLHMWRSESRKRTQAMPHIKTYTRVTSDLQHAHYFLLTSANLSKAAWGCLQKAESQLFIRSYELGVILLPKFVTGDTEFTLGPSGTLSLPYDLPLTPYPAGTTPWFMNTKKTKKDVFGRTFP